ncbi:MAG: NAD(P)/FAD-dependent oxidoreductase [Cyanobacteria bacterium]|nr:NAD(P)/FAD-dependent oxidoreductase [Cyanobacteriota bacterium]
MLPNQTSVLVAGGGPAGFMAAITAAEAGVKGVLILEATAEPLHKVLISGGGRCNVTHACWESRVLVGHYPRGGKALLGPFSRFAAADTVAWFAARGLTLVEEADGRLFPSSHRSSSVVATLRRLASAAGVDVQSTQALQTAEASDGGFRLGLRGGGVVMADRLVLATGSHPSGHRLARALGHTIVPPVPSLFSLSLDAPSLRHLAGVAMDPVGLRLFPPSDQDPAPSRGQGAGEPLQRGAVLITHRGLSGPATLRFTAFAARRLRQWGYQATLEVDWTGGLSQAELEAYFGEARRQQARRQLGSWRPWSALSRRLWCSLLEMHGVAFEQRWADLSGPIQRQLIQSLRASRYPVVGRGPFGEEFVTAGGVPLAELHSTTLESRSQQGLYFAGEVLDVDGVTGGFNFQHCWTSGWLVGEALAALDGQY